MIIDTHSHIYSEQFDEDRDAMIQRAFESETQVILMPNVDVASIEPMLQIEAKYPNNCFSMMGLHPTSVNKDYQLQLDEMYKALSQHKYIAVGEIGIDLYWDKTFVNQQIDAFKQQITWAKEFDLPIVIHARDAFDEVFQVMDDVGVRDIKGVFHSFTGNYDQAIKALSYDGFKLAINGVVTFKNSGLDKVVEQLSLNDLVLETDAPYLTPTPHRGKRNEPKYINLVAKKVGEIFDVSTQEVATITTQNARALFALPA
ncbi:TatD family hydrolase [Saccharicrinis aurantiacus]|uniref:TatD family hydrolase n=1 Tax=Saccharicrinis aurantiacus TaxID=1849719 RepID=UPI000AF69630|nr:TatD family hydrolase [Saccharicrinis aurantiacus]